MDKVLLACVAPLIVAAPARAEPISLAVSAVAAAGSIGAAITSSAVGAFLINTGIALGISVGIGDRISRLRRRK